MAVSGHLAVLQVSADLIAEALLLYEVGVIFEHHQTLADLPMLWTFKVVLKFKYNL